MNASDAIVNTSEALANTPPAPPTTSTAAPEPEMMKLKHLSRLLHVPARWRILRELAKGEALPVTELARRVNCAAPTVSKHMALLKQAGVVKTGYGRLYRLTPGIQPEPGGQRLDLGHCILKLDSGW